MLKHIGGKQAQDSCNDKPLLVDFEFLQSQEHHKGGCVLYLRLSPKALATVLTT